MGRIVEKKRMSLFSLIVQTCLILHNMNMDDNNFELVDIDDEEQADVQVSDLPLQDIPEAERLDDLDAVLNARSTRFAEIQDENEHKRLYEALVEHVHRQRKKRKTRKI